MAKDDPRKYPNRDLRAMDQWLRTLTREKSLHKYAAGQNTQALQADVRRALSMQLDQERPLVQSNDQPDLPINNSPIKDRPLDYPFTKGISVLNDGVAYGELIYEKRAQSECESALLRVRRTKTGRIEFRPDLGDAKAKEAKAKEAKAKEAKAKEAKAKEAKAKEAKAKEAKAKKTKAKKTKAKKTKAKKTKAKKTKAKKTKVRREKQ